MSNKILTPREKAEELIEKFKQLIEVGIVVTKEDLHEYIQKQAKKFALIVVESHQYSENNSPFLDMASWVKDNVYWYEVEKEIELYPRRENGNKFIIITELKELESKVSLGEITYGRMIELLNERAEAWYKGKLSMKYEQK